MDLAKEKALERHHDLLVRVIQPYLRFLSDFQILDDSELESIINLPDKDAIVPKFLRTLKEKGNESFYEFIKALKKHLGNHFMDDIRDLKCEGIFGENRMFYQYTETMFLCYIYARSTT